jgi:hypothetical protein
MKQLSYDWERFGQRVFGAIRLRSDVYREVAAAPSGLAQAVAVILLSSLASAVVQLVDGASPSLGANIDWDDYAVTRESSVVAALAGAALDAGWGLLIWAAQAAIVWFLWNRFGSRQRTWRAIAAPLGFASAPLIVFGLLELVPAIGGALAAVGLFWTLIASVAALRAALDTGWGRALLLMVLSTVALLPLPLAITWLS